jgi:hypothetical protein
LDQAGIPGAEKNPKKNPFLGAGMKATQFSTPNPRKKTTKTSTARAQKGANNK